MDKYNLRVEWGGQFRRLFFVFWYKIFCCFNIADFNVTRVDTDPLPEDYPMVDAMGLNVIYYTSSGSTVNTFGDSTTGTTGTTGIAQPSQSPKSKSSTGKTIGSIVGAIVGCVIVCGLIAVSKK
jgi:hypothetical protein